MLEELPYSLGNLSSLSELWLQGNQLRNIDSFSSLKVYLTINAIHCSKAGIMVY